MANAPIDITKMRVGKKGGGKHWTKAQIAARAKAAAMLKSKAPPRLKSPARINPPAGANEETRRAFKAFSSAVRKVWQKTVRAMEEMGILENADEDILAAYCTAVVREEECNRKVQEEGYTTLGASGPTVSPYVRAQQGYSRLVLQYAEKLGLTPAARARIAKRLADDNQDKKDKNSHLFA